MFDFDPDHVGCIDVGGVIRLASAAAGAALGAGRPGLPLYLAHRHRLQDLSLVPVSELCIPVFNHNTS